MQARTLIERSFAGRSSSALTVVVHSPSATTSAPAFREALLRVERVLAGDARVASVQRPRPGATISADGHTAVVTAGAKGDPTAMVAAADALKPQLERAGSPSVAVSLTGSPAIWSEFNTANKAAMMKSELLSWPVTMAIIVLAFGSLVAAGLPLLLTILGLVSSAGLLALLTGAFDISIWAMNFALMFSLALGIDYALFIVHRFRASLRGSRLGVRDAVVVTMDTAGKAVLFSAMTVLVSLSAVLLVPSPAFRSTALGIMLSVAFVLAATLTLLPAVLAKLGPRIDALPLGRARSRADRSPRAARWGERLWRQAHLFGPAAAVVLVVLALPVLGLKTGMPSIKVVPQGDGARVGYAQLQQAFGAGAPGALQIVAPQREAAAVAAAARRDPGIARVLGPEPGAGGLALIQAIPGSDPSSAATGRTIDRLRAALPPGALVGGHAAENHDLASALRRTTPLVIGAVLALGFLLLLVVVQAPLIAALAVVTNLLATGAAFGVGRLIFQDGHGQRPARLRAAGLHGRVGAGVLLRDDLRDLDGLHRLPARVGQGALGPLARPARGRGRRPRGLGARHLRRRGGDGRRLLHLRALRAAAAQGDGRDPRRLRAARRDARPARAAPGADARLRAARVGAAAPARPAVAGRPLRALVSTWREPCQDSDRLVDSGHAE